MNDNAAKAEMNASSDVAVGESEKKVQDLQYQVQDLTSEKVISIFLINFLLATSRITSTICCSIISK